MTVQWGEYVLRTFVAPDAAALTSVAIPDLRPAHPEASHWLSNWVLNSVMRGRFTAPTHQQVAAFLHRTGGLFQEFHLARDRTLDLVRIGTDKAPALYFEAARRWENTVLGLQMAMEIFIALNPTWNEIAKNGTPEARIHAMGNRAKHYGETTINAGVADIEGLVLPIWFDNHGLVSVNKSARQRISATYAEVASLVGDVAILADRLQDPTTALGSKGQ